MTKDEAEKLIETIRSLMVQEDRQVIAGGRRAGKMLELGEQKANGKALTMDRALVEGTDNTGGHLKPFELPELEALYQQFKGRLIEECAIDPTLLHLLTTRPEIVVEVERNVVELDGSSLRGRIATVAAAGYLAEPRRAADIRKQMERTGPAVNTGDLSKALKLMQRDGLIVNDSDFWTLAPGVKVTERTLESR